MSKKPKQKLKRGKPKRKERKMVTHRTTRQEEESEASEAREAHAKEAHEAEAKQAASAKTVSHNPQSRALAALDDQIRATTGGEPGAGLYSLLSLVAGQFLGVPRSAMPVAPAAKDNAN
jgi:hypothetical protein